METEDESKSETGITVADFWRDIEELHLKFGFERAPAPRFLPRVLNEMRINFLLEELMETARASGITGMRADVTSDGPVRMRLVGGDGGEHDLEQALDGLVDLVYVALGTAWMMGLDFPEAWRRVHAANMRKECARRAEDSKRGTAVDLVKPPGWKPADLSDLTVCRECGGERWVWLPGRPAHVSNRVPCEACKTET